MSCSVCNRVLSFTAVPMPLNVMNSNKQMMVLVDNILLLSFVRSFFSCTLSHFFVAVLYFEFAFHSFVLFAVALLLLLLIRSSE